LTDFSDKKGGNLSNHNLIKRYNYYSMRVLNSMEENVMPREEERPKATPKAKKIRLDEEIVDLEKDERNSMSLRGAPLNLTHIDRYFYAPKANDSKQTQILNNLTFDPIETCQSTLSEMREWHMDIGKVIPKY
jgi:hypothetical protein